MVILIYDHFDKDSQIEHTSGDTPTYPNSMKTTLLQNLDYDNFTLFQMSDDDFMARFQMVYQYIKTKE